MLNLRAITNLGLVSVLLCGTVGCGDKSEMDKIAAVKPLEMLSIDGVGPINAQTRFNLHDITTAFPNLNVTQRQYFNHGKPYPVIEVLAETTTLMVLNPDVKQQKVFSVMVKDNLIGNRLGHKIGMSFADIYAYGKTETCAAGAEELAGKVLCYAPHTGNILYLFGGQWNGAVGTVPPKDVLAGWKMDAIIWKPPVASVKK